MYVYCIYNTYIFPHPIFEQCGPTSGKNMSVAKPMQRIYNKKSND